MEPLDLFSLQQTYNQQRIMLCFNGPLTQSLIEEIGNALRKYMQSENLTQSSLMDIFAAYIELTQNIRHYTAAKGWGENGTVATVVIAHDADGRHVVSAGNVIADADGQGLVSRIEAIAAMDKAQLKSAYKEQLRKPRADGAHSGAGLGLLDMARKASAPLACSLREIEGGRSFFSLRVVI